MKQGQASLVSGRENPGALLDGVEAMSQEEVQSVAPLDVTPHMTLPIEVNA